MISLFEDCELISLSESNMICDFRCDNPDLNDFFCNDALDYQNQLFGQTSFFRLKESKEIVCAYTLSNDSIKVNDLPGSVAKRVKRNIPHAKSMKSYPATLIGRFGVPLKFERNGIGTQVMDFIKSICISEETNKCRFILVDAYNTENALEFYSKNDFLFLFSTVDQEKEHYGKDNGTSLNTRFMYFDLLTWVNKMAE